MKTGSESRCNLSSSIVYAFSLSHKRSSLAYHVLVGVAGIIHLLFNRWNGLANLARSTHTDGIGRDVLCHHRASGDGRTSSDPNARKDDNIAADPAVVFNKNRVAELDEFDSGQHAGFVAGAEDTDIGGNLNTVADDDEAGVEDSEAVGDSLVILASNGTCMHLTHLKLMKQSLPMMVLQP